MNRMRNKRDNIVCRENVSIEMALFRTTQTTLFRAIKPTKIVNAVNDPITKVAMAIERNLLSGS